MTRSVRPTFCAGLVGVAFLMVTGWAYYCWYHILLARGNGSFHDVLTWGEPFHRARLCLAVALPVGLVTFELTHKQLPVRWRMAYTVMLALAVAFFAVGWIIKTFAVSPHYWN